MKLNGIAPEVTAHAGYFWAPSIACKIHNRMRHMIWLNSITCQSSIKGSNPERRRKRDRKSCSAEKRLCQMRLAIFSYHAPSVYTNEPQRLLREKGAIIVGEE